MMYLNFKDDVIKTTKPILEPKHMMYLNGK